MVQVLINEIVLNRPGMFKLPTGILPGEATTRLHVTLTSPATAPTKSPLRLEVNFPVYGHHENIARCNLGLETYVSQGYDSTRPAIFAWGEVLMEPVAKIVYPLRFTSACWLI